MSGYIEGFEDGVRATKAEYLKLLEEESHPVKELTISIVDVDNLAKQFWYNEGSGFHFHYYDFALAILKKAQEK